MIKYLILLILSFEASAYTLNNNFGASFDKDTVKVRIAGNTTCAGVNLTPYELEDLIEPAIDNFWNRVATSRLRLKLGTPTDNLININTGRLCSPTDDACINTAGATLIPEVNDIVIACNDMPQNYDATGNSGNVLAVTIPNHFKGKKIKGSVILINDDSAQFKALSRSGKIAVISHEIGHAIGLGHSEKSAALMYYQTVEKRTTLGQDDIDGVTYLYGNQLPGDLGGCGILGGTIALNGSDDDDINPHLWQMGIGFMMLLLLARMRAYFKALRLVPRRAHSAS